MQNSPELKALIRKNSHLFWYTKDSEKENLPLPVVLEFFINYASREDIKELFRIVGIKNAAKVAKEAPMRVSSKRRIKISLLKTPRILKSKSNIKVNHIVVHA